MHTCFCLRAAAVMTIWASSAAAGAAELVGSAFGFSEPLFASLNPSFTSQWDQSHPQNTVRIQMMAGESSSDRFNRVRSNRLDIVILSEPGEIDRLAQTQGTLAKDWSTRLPHASSPFYSTVVFLVRKGNPRKIKDWQDLAREDVSVVMANPQVSSAGRYAYLAAWQSADESFRGDVFATISFMRRFLANASTLQDDSAKASEAFVSSAAGDVLVTYEAFARTLKNQHAAEGYEVITPSSSVLVPISVAWLDKNVQIRGTESLAKEYVKYLYSPTAQKILVDFSYRVYDPKTLAAYPDIFPGLKLFQVQEQFGSWPRVFDTQFDGDGICQRLLSLVKKEEKARTLEAQEGAKQAAQHTQQAESSPREHSDQRTQQQTPAVFLSTEDALSAGKVNQGPVQPHGVPGQAAAPIPAASPVPTSAPGAQPNPAERPSESMPQSQLTRPVVTGASKAADKMEPAKAQTELLRPAPATQK